MSRTQNVFSHDDNSQPLFFSEDAESVEVAELKADDLQEISYAASKVGESLAPVEVELTDKHRSDYEEDREANEPRLELEELPSLNISSRDDAAIRAFKIVFSELINRRNCSKYTVAIFQRSGKDKKFSSAPSLACFVSDALLCGKRCLLRSNYEILCRCVEEDFERWVEVPEHLRYRIMRATGHLLIKRGIFPTKRYWYSTPRRVAPPQAFRLV